MVDVKVGDVLYSASFGEYEWQGDPPSITVWEVRQAGAKRVGIARSHQHGSEYRIKREVINTGKQSGDWDPPAGVHTTELGARLALRARCERRLEEAQRTVETWSLRLALATDFANRGVA